jgi:hypothetical protein
MIINEIDMKSFSFVFLSVRDALLKRGLARFAHMLSDYHLLYDQWFLLIDSNTSQDDDV